MDWILWVDIETTGLDVERDIILQMAFILTDCKNDTVHYMREFTFPCDKSKLESMNNWCKEQHTRSGLYQLVSCQKGNNIDCINEAEKHIILTLNQHLKVRDTLYFAGNSVHFDKMFITKHMPALAARASHRIVDVSTLSILCRNLNPSVHSKRPTKQQRHTALDDILESIDEYRYYKSTFLVVEDAR